MSSAEYLRELISERLTAAAEEIFQGFQKTIVVYEEEIDRQRRLLDVVLKPEIKLHRTELLKQHVCKEEEVLADQQLCNQERNSSPDQNDPEPPQIKEEHEEICTSLEGEPLLMKQETETCMLIPACEDRDNSEDQTLDLSPYGTRSAAENENVVGMSVKSSVDPEPNSRDQLLSHNSHIAKSQDHKGGKQGDSGSTRNAEPKSQKQCRKSKNVSNNKDNITTLKIRSNAYTGKQGFECDTCGKTFKYKCGLHRHQRIHTGEKPYPCNTCGKRFTEQGALKAHLRVHTGEKPYPCNTCGKRFTERGTLTAHIRIHTGEKPYNCKTCGKGYRRFADLKAHVRIHTGEKPYNCQTCGKGFRLMAVLKKHMRVHTGEKPYPCNTCQKRFSHQDALKVHSRIHTGEKPYHCKICGKGFRVLTVLKKHMRVHTGEKPYPCNTCEKRFPHQGALKVHVRIHTGEKPYNCKTCGRDFRHSYQLTVHMRTHAMGKDSVRCQDLKSS